MPRSRPAAGAGLKIDARARAARRVEGRAGGEGRDLVADEDDVRVTEPDAAQRSRDLRRGEPAVGARGHGDHVLAGGVDEDESDAGRRTVERAHLAGVDRLRVERRPSRLPVRVASDGADERHRRPETSRRDSLVRALAAVVLLEGTVADGLAGRRKTLDPGHKVDVDGSDHDHPAVHGAPVNDPRRCLRARDELAAVDADDVAGDEIERVVAQRHDRPRDVLRSRHPSGSGSAASRTR